MKAQLLFLLALALPLFAQGLPKVAVEAQKKAPEQVFILVSKIEKTTDDDHIELAVEAKVVEVVKSQSNLKKDDIIKLLYKVPRQTTFGNYAGEVGKGNYKAYLKADKKDKTLYHPAALQGSFVAVAE